MDYAGHENYYIREDALLFVLAAIGIEDWYQFSKEKRHGRASKEEINKILVCLYQDNYVTWEGDTIQLLEPLNTLAYIIKNAHDCVTVKMEKISYFCYCANNKILVLEPGRQDYEKIRFNIWEKEEFIEYLWSLGVFPKEELENPEGEADPGEMYTNAVITLSEKDLSKQKSEMKISEAGIFTNITITEGKNKWKKLYNEQYCKDTLDKWLQMEE